LNHLLFQQCDFILPPSIYQQRNDSLVNINLAGAKYKLTNGIHFGNGSG